VAQRVVKPIGTREAQALTPPTEVTDTLELSARDAQAFAEAFANPKPMNPRLRETVRRYREATQS